MGKTTALRRELKARFVPFMAAKGFLPDNRHAPEVLGFRKITPEHVYVCEIQWDKYGGARFRLNFGRCSSRGTIAFDEHILPSDIFTWQTPEHGTLAPGTHISTRGWFRQDNSLFSRLLGRPRLRPAAKVVDDLEQLFPEVEAFWKSGTPGPHIRVFPGQLVKNVDRTMQPGHNE